MDEEILFDYSISIEPSDIKDVKVLLDLLYLFENPRFFDRYNIETVIDLFNKHKEDYLLILHEQ
jgi:hypothetical protein